MDFYDVMGLLFVCIVATILFVFIGVFESERSTPNIVNSCEKAGTFFVGDKVFDCKLRSSK